MDDRELPLILVELWASRVGEFWRMASALKFHGMTLLEDLTFEQRKLKKTQLSEAHTLWDENKLSVTWRKGYLWVKPRGSKDPWGPPPSYLEALRPKTSQKTPLADDVEGDVVKGPSPVAE